ncbi:989_t:CDS:2 [Paraglomus occultum]|uniref:989_t:CDS:1 n=1 Tax=Paraglomus occultum TaxID=144539 RepID=A0A9N9CFP0_9GLOM|nr:989_t:CDS:2 [Paraglomus occultum]
MENVLARPPGSQKIPAQVGNVFIASKLPGKLTSGKYLKQDKFDNGRRALGTIENVDENAGQLEKLKENDPILAIKVLDRAHSKAPIVKQLRNELQEAHSHNQVLEQKLHSLQDEQTRTQEEMSRLLAKIRSFRRFETRLQSFDNRLRVIEDKECEPYPFELDASDIETSVDIIEARIEYLELPKHERHGQAHRDSIVEQEFIGGTKRSEQSDLLEDIMVNREEYAAVVEEREKYKKEAEENWQIVKELEGMLMEKNEEIEYLQGQLSKADNEC